jgi:hypothetical protein
MRSIIGCSALAVGLLLGPTHTCQAQEKRGSSGVIEVQNKDEALKTLKDKGINATELKGEKFELPTIRVRGNEAPFDPGDEIILEASIDKTKIPENLVEIRYKWIVIDNGRRRNMIVSDDGQKIGFGAGMSPRKIAVTLDVDCLFGVKDAEGFVNKASMYSPEPVITEVIVGNPPAPTPVPVPPTPVPIPPTPVPVPAPVFPDGQFGMAKFSYDAITSDTTITATDKVKLAQALAASFGGVAAKIAAVSTYTDVPTILADTKKANNDAINSSGVPMASTANLKKTLGDKIYSLYHDQQKVNTASDFAQLYREIRDGLNAVK